MHKRAQKSCCVIPPERVISSLIELIAAISNCSGHDVVQIDKNAAVKLWLSISFCNYEFGYFGRKAQLNSLEQDRVINLDRDRFSGCAFRYGSPLKSAVTNYELKIFPVLFQRHIEVVDPLVKCHSPAGSKFWLHPARALLEPAFVACDSFWIVSELDGFSNLASFMNLGNTAFVVPSIFEPS